MQSIQHASAADATVVTTAEEWERALFSGAEHIEMREHIDLTTPDYLASVGRLNGTFPETLKTLRVRSPFLPSGLLKIGNFLLLQVRKWRVRMLLISGTISHDCWD